MIMKNMWNPKTNPKREAVLQAQINQTISPNSKLIWDYKSSLPALDSFQLAMCTGLLLGDVSIVRNASLKIPSHKLKFEWGDRHSAYAQSVYDHIILYCLTSPRLQTGINAQNNSVKTWCFQTVTVPAFNILGQAFLMNKGKTLNMTMLEELMTPVSLAYWYMDDGHCGNVGRYGMYFNTQGFTHQEAEGLCSILRTKFNLDSWVRSKKSKNNIPYIVVSGHSYSVFFSYVEKYIHPSMRHKFPQGSRTQWTT